MAKKGTTPTINEFTVRDFSGGLNVRDASSELAKNEFLDAWNITIDERGGVSKRLGHRRRYGDFSSALNSSLVSNLFWFNGQAVTQSGVEMFNGNPGSSFHSWSTDARCGMCEFNGLLVMVHPVDGVRTWNGSAVGGPFTNAPTGNTCATWQNKVFVAGNTTNPSRVAWSNAGTVGTWTTTDFVDLREKDTEIITCLTGASGMDVSGRPGLLAFKKGSAYRIHDSATGAYSTIDPQVGCASNIAAVNAYGRTYTISPSGIYYTDGLTPMVEVTGKVRPFFTPEITNLQQAKLFCAGRRFDRLFFSMPLAGATANNIALEVHPIAGWVVPHSNAASCYTFATPESGVGFGDGKMVMGSPTNNGRVYNSHEWGKDDQAAISSHFQTLWTDPNYGNLTRLRRLRVVGLGNFNTVLYKDYEQSASFAALPTSIQSPISYYDTVPYFYDEPESVYSLLRQQGYQDFYSIGVVRSFSVRIEESSMDTLPGTELLEGVVPKVTGAWRLSSFEAMTIPLGIR